MLLRDWWYSHNFAPAASQGRRRNLPMDQWKDLLSAIPLIRTPFFSDPGGRSKWIVFHEHRALYMKAKREGQTVQCVHDKCLEQN